MRSMFHPRQFAALLVGSVIGIAGAQAAFGGPELHLAQADKPGPMQSNSGSSTAAPAAAPAAGAAKGATDFDVEKLFANTCGWCHSKGGREQGKGPKLMDNPISDADIVYRVKNGKTGYMPAFGAQFNDDQLKAIVAYIRNLKPQ